MKILLAEDDPSLMKSLREILENEGFTVLAATDGKQALKLWRTDNPLIACLDIMMPEIDGYEVCRRIRAVDQAMPILFISAKSDETDVVVGLEIGANDFIRKPFGKHEFMARVRATLRNRSQQTASATSQQFTFGRLVMHPDELRADDDGKDIELSPREIDIIRFLADRAGKVVRRDSLLDACWGMDYYPESRTLDQQISRLRKKIEADPARPELIETVRGIGYRHPISS